MLVAGAGEGQPASQLALGASDVGGTRADAAMDPQTPHRVREFVVHEDEEDSKVVLFSGSEAKLVQFSTADSDRSWDDPPAASARSPESAVAQGPVRVYRILKDAATFIQVGKFVHPLLPRTRVWRTGRGELLLPQPIPRKFWRLELEGARGIRQLEQVLETACTYKKVYDESAGGDGASAGDDLEFKYVVRPRRSAASIDLDNIRRQQHIRGLVLSRKESMELRDGGGGGVLRAPSVPNYVYARPSPADVRFFSDDREHATGVVDEELGDVDDDSGHFGAGAWGIDEARVPVDSGADARAYTLFRPSDNAALTVMADEVSGEMLSGDAQSDPSEESSPLDTPPNIVLDSALAPLLSPTSSRHELTSSSTLDAILDSFQLDDLAQHQHDDEPLFDPASPASEQSTDAVADMSTVGDISADTTLPEEGVVPSTKVPSFADNPATNDAKASVDDALNGSADTAIHAEPEDAALPDDYGVDDTDSTVTPDHAADKHPKTFAPVFHRRPSDFDAMRPRPLFIPPSRQHPPPRALLNHPLVPLSHRNNLVVSLQPLKFRPMDDDWLESPTSPPAPASSGSQSRARPSLFMQSPQPPAVIDSFIPRARRSSSDHPRDKRSIPGLYEQVAAISGYLGWRLMNSVAPHWVKR